MANVCREQFVAAGYDVAVAHDGRAAIEELVNRPPDLVLLDLMLPEVDGVSVLRFLRSHESLRDLPVVVVSNSSYFSGVVQAAWQAGATHFFNKGDCSPKMLLDEVRKVLASPVPAPAPQQVEPQPTPSRFQSPQTPPQSQSQSQSQPPSAQGSALRLLLADDDRLIHGVLEFFMKQANIHVRSAFNGREALAMAIEDPPDVLVLDDQMPELSGREVLAQWRHIPALAKVPVIMLTGSDVEAARSRAISEGASEFLTKPFSPDALVAKVMQFAPR